MFLKEKKSKKKYLKKRKNKAFKGPRLCWIHEDGIRPGRIVAAAEYVHTRSD